MSKFRFKEFVIDQEGAPFKVGTDSMILGSWVQLCGSEMMLDIGTGTGVLALMMAQRLTSGKVLAIEPEFSAFEIAEANVQSSPFSDRIVIVNEPLQKLFPNDRFDSIICNPPYFNDSTKSSSVSASMARHTVNLQFSDILRFTQDHLSDEGHLSLVLPVKEFLDFEKLASDFGLTKSRELRISTFENDPHKRVCAEFSKVNKTCHLDEMNIRNKSDEAYSERYRELTKLYHTHY